MFKSYVKTALRNILKHKGYSFISIFGLSLGIISCLLIALWIQDELSYDNFHENADRIFRIARRFDLPDVQVTIQNTPSPLADTLLQSYPEIEEAIRMTGPVSSVVKAGHQVYMEKNILWVDTGFFRVFSFPLLKGQAELDKPGTVVLTQKIAEKYFSGEDPLGKILTINEDSFEVTGICGDIPTHSHLQFDFVAPLSMLDQSKETSWAYNNTTTYVMLKSEHLKETTELKLQGLVSMYVAPGYEKTFGIKMPEGANSFLLQPVSDIHLGLGLPESIASEGNISSLYLFAALAIFILILACINFVNLATARSTERAMEVGMRKTLGAEKRQLIFQFLGDSILLSLAAVLLGVCVSAVLLPSFNAFTHKNISLFQNISILPILFATTLFIGTAAGIYPALILSRHQPLTVFKGTMSHLGTNRLRKILVIFQFTISIALLAGTTVLQGQIEFVKNKRLGFQKQHVVVLPKSNVLNDKHDTFIQEALKSPNILSAGTSYSLPGTFFVSSLFRPDGTTADMDRQLNYTWVDSHFVDTLCIELRHGRNFSQEFPTDTSAVLLNETAARVFGWDDPIGQRLAQGTGDRSWTVIGIVKDFHFQSLRSSIKPMALFYAENQNYLALRLRPDDVSGTLAGIKDLWNKFAPDMPFEYYFLDENFNRLYGSEEKMAQIFKTFTAMAFLIGAFGLFGLATFTAEKRTKEIGIRKTLGASVPNIVLLLSKDFIKLVGIAALVACPVAFLTVKGWMQNFAYRMEIGIIPFLTAGAAAILIAMISISIQSIRAGLADPVKSIRHQ